MSNEQLIQCLSKIKQILIKQNLELTNLKQRIRDLEYSLENPYKMPL